MATTSPLVAQLEFSVRIRERRRELELDARTVSSRMGFSRNYYSAVENNRAKLADDRLPELATILELDEATTAELASLLSASRKSGWWDAYSKFIDESFVELWALEDGGSAIDVYESSVVTGLLQTRQYAEAMIKVDPRTSAKDTRRFVEARMKRQERLAGGNPPELRVLLSESVVMQEVGGPIVLRGQLQYLLDKADRMRGALRLRITPFTATETMAASSLFFIGFDSPHLERVVWREAGSALGFSSDPDLLEDLSLAFDRVWDSALDEVETLNLIAGRAKSLSA
ncbi:MAG: DUF5753 domain-containing protein [Actinomycetota bacterium]